MLFLLIVAISICWYYRFWSLRSKKHKGSCKTVIVLGSGGHTGEMLRLVQDLDPSLYSPLILVHASSDAMSRAKAQDLLPRAKYCAIPRARNVGQSWLSSIPTSAYALLRSLLLVFTSFPDVILCNGPAFSGYLLTILGIKKVSIVFIESFARVQDISLSGKLLYPIADMFIVQWPGLLANVKTPYFLKHPPMDISIRPARLRDVEEACKCIHSAYRENQPGAWTSESHILSGQRISSDEFRSLVQTEADLPRIIVAELSDSQIVGTLEIEIEQPGKSVVLGLFSVSPAMQSNGIGKRLLTNAIDRAREAGYSVAVMYLIELRADLLQWYVKFGFRETGETKVLEELMKDSKVGRFCFKRLELEI
ncbi:MAG: hypothetical protein SGCHY_004166 [Lobulomycetales sp.]